MVQHLAYKPLCRQQKNLGDDKVAGYRTMDQTLWREAYIPLHSLHLKEDFYSPSGVYVATLLHGVEQCLGGIQVCAPKPVDRSLDN